MLRTKTEHKAGLTRKEEVMLIHVGWSGNWHIHKQPKQMREQARWTSGGGLCQGAGTTGPKTLRRVWAWQI